ncbi:AraC family transcriptional regulator [Paenibacillus eucommiae]|uniref:AraC-like DNA-binding protein n=1 Tax=Paenibacillus eucommiae TaxID=1355755 RepID=A0ABS4IVX4_9BACL|nr:AraC family transcriptional regulator [Paenibacillus eucommiae]MBP1991725.1 AraC-like DNA-binding protein [Paenibacillus eucommiae]
MEQRSISLNLELEISNLYTFYYFELTHDFKAGNDQHSFWEFVYIDKGQIHFYVDGALFPLKQGEIIFYKPNSIHWGHPVNHSTPNIMIVSFDCTSACMSFFENQSFPLTDSEKGMLSLILKEAYQSFELDLYSGQIARREPSSFGGEQFIKNYLEILLLQFIRRRSNWRAEPNNSSTLKMNREEDLIEDVIGFLLKNLAVPLSVEHICKHFGIGKTQLHTLFKAKTGYGLKQFFNRLKMEEAKKLIREDIRSITEISEALGFNNVQYFSKQFKQLTDMKPTEYARSIKARFGNGLSEELRTK